MARNPMSEEGLAIYLARGQGTIKEWAKSRGFPRRTVYRWSSRPELRARAAELRGRIQDLAVDLLGKRSAGVDFPAHPGLRPD
jgi:hypothetical protein